MKILKVCILEKMNSWVGCMFPGFLILSSQVTFWLHQKMFLLKNSQWALYYYRMVLLASLDYCNSECKFFLNYHIQALQMHLLLMKMVWLFLKIWYPEWLSSRGLRFFVQESPTVRLLLSCFQVRWIHKSLFSILNCLSNLRSYSSLKKEYLPFLAFRM